MRLRIADPSQIVVDREVTSVRAEDASGSFGILRGHADFLTALALSVVSWSEADGRAGHCAVRGGVLTVSGGSNIAIATREAYVDEDLDRLADVIVAGYRRHSDSEREGRTLAAKLRMRAIRNMVAALQGHTVEIEP